MLLFRRICVLLTFLFLAACGRSLSLEGKACPCVAGFVCDEALGICVVGLEDNSAVDSGSNNPAQDAGSDVDTGVGSDGGPNLPTFSDNFDRNNDLGDWVIESAGNWTTAYHAGTSPDWNQSMLGNFLQGSIISHPELKGMQEFRIEFDFKIFGANYGSFSVRLADPNDEGHFYSVLIIAANRNFNLTDDKVRLMVDSQPYIELDARAPTAPHSVWNHIVIERDATGIRATLNDMEGYMTTAEVPVSIDEPLGLGPPYDLFLRFWDGGALDNFSADFTQ